MPTLLARGQSSELVTRVRQYAQRHRLGISDAVGQLCTIALNHLDARSTGAAKVNDGRTADERSEAGRAAARARWAK